jgi:hypothetical protein
MPVYSGCLPLVLFAPAAAVLSAAGLTIRFARPDAIDAPRLADLVAGLTATISPQCGVGTYSIAGTGAPPCVPCPQGRFGRSFGLTSASCSGPCSRAPNPVLEKGTALLVCAEGAVSQQGVSAVVYPSRPFVLHQRTARDTWPSVVPTPSATNVIVAQLDTQDTHADLVTSQFWYKNDGSTPPSFTPYPLCMDSILYATVQAVDSKLFRVADLLVPLALGAEGQV